MREILFRGKRKDNGEWVYGYYSPANIPLMGCVGHFINEGGYRAIEIDPETVGQFTGLTDKNGTKIFEGDIVKDRHSKGVVAFGRHEICCCGERYDYHNSVGFYIDEGKDYAWSDEDTWDDFEVIGNIHDNPELMEVQDG